MGIGQSRVRVYLLRMCASSSIGESHFLRHKQHLMTEAPEGLHEPSMADGESCAYIGGQVAAVAIVSRDHHQVVLADRRGLDCDHDLARRQCDDARRCGGIEERLESFQPRPLFHSVMVEEVTTSGRVFGACNHNGPPESRQSSPHVQAGC